MSLEQAVAAAQWLILGYFTFLNAGYLLLYGFAFTAVRRYLESRLLDQLPSAYSGLEPPVSVVVPAYNEEATIATSVRSMLQLDYPDFEVIVVNDGSTDGTMQALREAFALVPHEEAYWRRLPVQRVRAIYRSMRFPNLRVIDKENGGKADALNAGINASRCPLYCGVDADSILERASLRRVIAPFVEDPTVIASGGTVRVANGCTVREGFLESVALPGRLLPLLQVIEYLRAFLFGRMGWTPVNAVLIISGAFGLFRKDTVVAAGGYRSDTVGEDMELVVRLHRMHRERGRPYRIVYVPDPICWTEAPESLRVLRSQRVRWQRGLAESLTLNLGLAFGRRGGVPGWLAFPFMALFEWLGPLIEVGGFALLLAGLLAGLVSGAAFIAFLVLAVGMGMVLSASALLLEEISFHVYMRPRELALLVFAALAENLGYRQLNALWRLEGLARWAFGARARWGEMTRSAKWQKGD